MLDKTNIPQHVGIIMDGNRRWAKKRGLPPIAGHARAVDKTVEELIESAGEMGIKYLTLWAFSTENWGRAEEEVAGLMSLFRKALMTKVQKLIKKGARLRMIGDLSRFPPDIQEGMKKATSEGNKNSKITVVFALNYGGRDEILRAVNRLISESAGQRMSLLVDQKEKEKIFSDHLDTAGMPDPELIIRTGGEQRLSGFLMWQSAYSEFYFSDDLFPDFTPEKFEQAIEDYQGRQRRFGK